MSSLTESGKRTHTSENTMLNIFLTALICQMNKVRLMGYCRFSYAGNWVIVKSIVGTKYRRSHICLNSQAKNRLYQLVIWHLLLILIHFRNCNEMALLLFFMLYNKFSTKTETGDKSKYYRLPRSKEAEQQSTKKNAS